MRLGRRLLPSVTALVLSVGLLLPGATAGADPTAEPGDPGGDEPERQRRDGDEPPDTPVDLKLLATNDIHGQLLPPVDDYGGAAYLAAHLGRIRQDHPSALHVDVGDATGGSGGLSRRFGDEPTIEALDLMGLDVQALGNHEFDYGRDELERRYAGGCWLGDCAYRDGSPYPGASWPALAGNVTDRDTGEAPFPGTWITEVDGVDVGFLGVTSTDLITESGNGSLAFAPWWTRINELASELEEAGADIIVALRHVGTRQDTDINACEDWTGATAQFSRQHIDPAVDVVVDGHTHSAYVCDEEGSPLTTQAFHRTLMFTEIDLTYDTERDEVVERSATNRWVDHESVAPDPEVLELIEQYQGWR